MKRSRIKHYLRYSLLAIFALVIVWLSWRTYVYFNPRLLVDFQYYEPVKVVDGLHVTSIKRLENWTSSPWTWFASTHTDTLVALNRPNSWIEETKMAQGTLSPEVFDRCGPNVANLKCVTKYTSKRTKYYLTLVYDANAPSYQKVAGEDVAVRKGNTWIDISIAQGPSQTPVSDQAWSDMIDSFAPAKLDGFKVYRMHPGP